ncbi:hypothetical protein D4R99_02545 [bacterium]|nr:MAG: hypothetical protein D4R99_02545 [bacterium]
MKKSLAIINDDVALQNRILDVIYVIAILQLLMTVLAGMPIYLLPMAILLGIAQTSILFMFVYIFFVLPVKYIMKKTEQPEVDSE